VIRNLFSIHFGSSRHLDVCVSGLILLWLMNYFEEPCEGTMLEGSL
jgi:hypothetical protein